ncbi:hypothetical protein KL953_08630 [Mycolicibacterium goodii]|uniref:hypothetical protein n=1 Tax=Mycolicibacterium goodii TaxID=134601 RepID=UPI001BDBB906|nr:hypothetical protein [Mycolicibacterium goodii]MBU8808960.1 hypothetical protein [Mycolicibacterium goodii]
MSEQEQYKWVPEGFNWNYTGEEPSVVQLPMTQQQHPPAVQYSPTGWYYPQPPQQPEHKGRGWSVNLGMAMLATVSFIATLFGTLVLVLGAFGEGGNPDSFGFAILWFAWGTAWSMFWLALGTFAHKGRGR